RVFNVDDGNNSTIRTMSISGLTLTGGDVNGNGGAISARVENFTLSDCVLVGNSAVNGGGISGGATIAIVTNRTATIVYPEFSVSNCVINNNLANSNNGGNGGGISAGKVTVVGSTISGNSNTRVVNVGTISGGNGGGISASYLT